MYFYFSHTCLINNAYLLVAGGLKELVPTQSLAGVLPISIFVQHSGIFNKIFFLIHYDLFRYHFPVLEKANVIETAHAGWKINILLKLLFTPCWLLKQFEFHVDIFKCQFRNSLYCDYSNIFLNWQNVLLKPIPFSDVTVATYSKRYHSSEYQCWNLNNKKVEWKNASTKYLP